ncbi:MAG: hypothetical protein KF832_11125 [Caldilineaceae bacterium]|nr:hypothetical protein [Caldilineaceae bacterium]
MIRFWGFLQVREQPTLPAEKVDLGDGRFVEPEDVLDSHFSRRLETPHLTFHVEGDLNRALTALAPGLASLTELAEEVDQAVPRVQPAPQFRHDLHKALELTHRQHHAQRVLGTRVDKPEPQTPWGLIVLMMVLLTCAVSTTLFLMRRRAVQVA